VNETSARNFLSAMFEPLKLWHSYLLNERQWKSGLVWIRHPWESGAAPFNISSLPFSNVAGRHG